MAVQPQRGLPPHLPKPSQRRSIPSNSARWSVLPDRRQTFLTSHGGESPPLLESGDRLFFFSAPPAYPLENRHIDYHYPALEHAPPSWRCPFHAVCRLEWQPFTPFDRVRFNPSMDGVHMAGSISPLLLSSPPRPWRH